MVSQGEAHMGYGIDNTLQRIQETDASRVAVTFHSRLMDKLANKVIDDHHRIQFLLDQFWGFTPQKGRGLPPHWSGSTVMRSAISTILKFLLYFGRIFDIQC
jgi:hypothetical protein